MSLHSLQKSSYKELLENDITIWIHDQNLKFIATELYQVLHGISPVFIRQVFPLNNALVSIARAR